MPLGNLSSNIITTKEYGSKPSSKLELYRSPQDTINSFIFSKTLGEPYTFTIYNVNCREYFHVFKIKFLINLSPFL